MSLRVGHYKGKGGVQRGRAPPSVVVIFTLRPPLLAAVAPTMATTEVIARQ